MDHRPHASLLLLRGRSVVTSLFKYLAAFYATKPVAQTIKFTDNVKYA